MQVRRQEEIDEVLHRCIDQHAAGGSAYPGMTYEEGVDAALRWVTGKSDNPVFDSDADDALEDDEDEFINDDDLDDDEV
jgi:hypothetical protein